MSLLYHSATQEDLLLIANQSKSATEFNQARAADRLASRNWVRTKSRVVLAAVLTVVVLGTLNLALIIWALPVVRP